MMAIAKVVSPPPALFGMVQWNRYTYRGKTISTMGMIDFWPEKNRMVFRPSRVPAIFRESRFYLNSLIFGHKYHPSLKCTLAGMQKCRTISERLQIGPGKWLETYARDKDIADIQQEFEELPDKDNVNDGSDDKDDMKQPPELPEEESYDAEDRKQTPEFLGHTTASFDAE
jgi:hypothetical protein